MSANDWIVASLVGSQTVGLGFAVFIGESPIFQSHGESPGKRVDDGAAVLGQGDVIESPYEEPKFENGSVIVGELFAVPLPNPLSCWNTCRGPKIGGGV
ncbi:hypothetical protein F1880_001330 [Penicillium rolfsii]|nr:hypothetical protein F1880_001330 [Penicillium rolfsii]